MLATLSAVEELETGIEEGGKVAMSLKNSLRFSFLKSHNKHSFYFRSALFLDRQHHI